MTHPVFAKASIEERRNMERVLVGGGLIERGGYKYDGNGTVRTSTDHILLGNKRDYNGKDPASHNSRKVSKSTATFPVAKTDVTDKREAPEASSAPSPGAPQTPHNR